MKIIGIYDSTKQSIPVYVKKIVSLIKKNNSHQSFTKNYVHVFTYNNSKNYDQDKILTTSNHCLLGKVFSKKTYQPITQEELSSISNHKEFVEKYWGKYVLISINDKTTGIDILNDPTGQMSLFYTKTTDGSILFSSDLASLYELMTIKPSINNQYIANFITLGIELYNHTIFKEIFDLRPGCQLRILPQVLHEKLCWNPTSYIGNFQNNETTQKKIVETLLNVLTCWNKDNDGILLDFSGGTDSSAILFGLQHIKGQHQQVHAINNYNSHSRSSDERIHARTIAQECNALLIEIDSLKELPFDTVEKLPLCPNYPSTNLFHVKAEQNQISYSNSFNKPCFVNGHGGDHIFLCPTPISVLSDLLIDKRFKDFNAQLKELAMMHRKPASTLYTKIIKDLGSHYLSLKKTKSSFLFYLGKPVWLKKEIFNNGKEYLEHPFYTTSNHQILPGKYGHIDATYRGIASIKGNLRDHYEHPIFYPFLSQPLIELTLSFPTYETFAQGYNRYPFRKAISDYFGTQKVWRKDKGCTNGILQLGLKQNKKIINDLCLNGYSANHKLIEKDILSQHLKHFLNGNLLRQGQIINLLAIEMFLKCWSVK